MINFAQFKKQEGSKDTFMIRETSKKQIRKLLTSKTSTCWCNGRVLDGWVFLAALSPQSKGDKQTRIYCSVNDVPEDLKKDLVYLASN